VTTLYITRGLPGSGKTTWAEITAQHLGAYAVSRDELRFALYNKFWGLTQDEENYITKVQRELVKAHLKHQDVIVHDTCLPDKVCREWRDLARSVGSEFSIKDLRGFPLDLCLMNVSRRAEAGGRPVPVDVIENMWHRQIKGRDLSAPLADPAPVGPRVIKQYVPDTSLPEAVIVDIDGTLANHEGVRGPYDAHLYHLDTVHMPIKRIVNLLAESIDVLVTSGRDAAYRNATDNWLTANDIWFDKLIMRKAGDRRNDAIVKEELFWEQIAPYHNVIAAFDDRNRVVDQWRAMGIKTLQVQPGDF
jgi:predicted kinase